MRDYDPLRQFVELTRSLNFGRAARACHLSPSALSRAIQRLESEVGEPLFEREHHRVTLSPAGDAFRRHALAVLEEWDAYVASRAAQRDALNGTVHLYCTVTAAQSLVPDLMNQLRRTHPGIRLELATGYATDAIDRLRSGDIDVSIAALPERLPAGVRSRLLTTTPVVFAAPADAAPRASNWPHTEAFVLPAHGLARVYADEWFARRNVEPNVYAQIEGHEAILSLVALGCGVGVVPRLVLEKSALRDRVVEVPVRPPLGRFRIGLCVRERSLNNPLVAAVWDAEVV